MYNNIIKNALRNMISEEKTPGIDNTKNVTTKSGDSNDEYYKEVESKMKEYDDNIRSEEQEPVKVNATDKQKEYHDQMEIRNGQEMLKYDQEPSKKFKERAEMALKGDSTMGNKTHTGKWNPETGEGNGNTEPVWGASDANFGEQLINTAKASQKKREDATPSMTQFGDDIEMNKSQKPTKGASRKYALESEQKNKEVIKENKTTMKKLTFKKEFGGVDKAIKLIPEHLKNDNQEFIMTDLNETYHIRWEGNLNEGEAVVLSGENKKLVNEDIEKMKKLWGFDSKKTLGTLKPKDRVQENKEFNKIFGKTKDLLK
jgi:hypothetical protein